jgi:photosystem II stability/assembly factor-like uncharacterized protein
MFLLLLSVHADSFGSNARSAKIQSMHLLSPQAGWAATDHSLFCTTDEGQHWRDIPPKLDQGQSIDSVFFIDDHLGWAVLISEGERESAPHFAIASTTNSGETWAIAGLKYPLNPRMGTLTGGSHMSFADPAHGWINIPVVSGSAFRLAALLVTSDGGQTWDWSPGGSGTEGSLRFKNPLDGWVAGAPATGFSTLRMMGRGAGRRSDCPLRPKSVRPSIPPTNSHPSSPVTAKDTCR